MEEPPNDYDPNSKSDHSVEVGGIGPFVTLERLNHVKELARTLLIETNALQKEFPSEMFWRLEALQLESGIDFYAAVRHFETYLIEVALGLNWQSSVPRRQDPRSPRHNSELQDKAIQDKNRRLLKLIRFLSEREVK